MGSEDLTMADVGGAGVRGDRGYALIDEQTGCVVSAKQPRRWPGLLAYQARFTEALGLADELPPVVITCPDGTSASSAAGPALDALLSARLGRPVRLTSVP